MNYTMQLIAAIEQHSELYDTSHGCFNNKEHKDEIWRQITHQLRGESDEQSVHLVKGRWKSLRDAFVKETKYRTALGNGEHIKPKRSWRYSQSMQFLAPFLGPSGPFKPRRKTEKIEPMENFFVTSKDLMEESENDNSVDEWMTGSQSFLGFQSPVGLPDNELDSFFKGISDTVKKLSPVNQVQVQRDIVNLVLDAKLKEIESKMD